MQRLCSQALDLLLVLLLVQFLASLGMTEAKASPSPQQCVKLQGIKSGGGEGMIDLDVTKVSLKKEPFDPSNQIVTAVVRCSSGLETPVSMRNLLGEHFCTLGFTTLNTVVIVSNCIGWNIILAD